MGWHFWTYLGLLLGGVIIGGCTSENRRADDRLSRNARASSGVIHPSRFRIEVRDGNGNGVPEVKEGFIDATGHIVIPAKFRSVGDFYEGLASVYNGDRQSFIDTSGKMVFSVPADWATDGLFSEGLALVNVGGTTDYHKVEGGYWGYMDRRGKLAIPARFFISVTNGYDFSMNGASRFNEGLAAMISADGKWGYINKSGEWVIPPHPKEPVW